MHTFSRPNFKHIFQRSTTYHSELFLLYFASIPSSNISRTDISCIPTEFFIDDSNIGCVADVTFLCAIIKRKKMTKIPVLEIFKYSANRHFLFSHLSSLKAFRQ